MGSSNLPMNPTNRSILNDHKVDALTTKDNNMRMRKIVNSAPATDSNDCVILSQLNSTSTDLTNQINQVGTSSKNLRTLVANLITYGTHAHRTTAVPSDGAVYFETDRGNVQYEFQNGTWVYVGGAMLGTLSPDQRPTDLGTNDVGFVFKATDSNRSYRWTGSAWTLEIPLGNSTFFAIANATLTLTTSFQNVPGASLNITIPGYYFVSGVFMVVYAHTDVGNFVEGGLSTNPSNLAIYARLGGSFTDDVYVTVSQTWVVQITSVPTTLSLTALKSGGTGSSAIDGTHTSISAILVD